MRSRPVPDCTDPHSGWRHAEGDRPPRRHGDIMTAPRSGAGAIDSHVVLRDGSGAALRLTVPADRDAVRLFFHDLSPESRRRRVFTLAEPADAFIDAFCDSSHLRRQATIIALRLVDGELRPMAVGSYLDLGS